MSEKVIKTSNGVILDPKGGWAELVTGVAKKNGLPIIGYLASFPAGEKIYILVRDGEIIYENYSYESVCAHLEIMALGKEGGK